MKKTLQSNSIGVVLLDDNNSDYDGRIEYTRLSYARYKISGGTLSITGSVFDLVVDAGECEEIDFVIDCVHGVFEFYFTLFECKINRDACILTVQPRWRSPYSCIESKGSQKLNILEVTNLSFGVTSYGALASVITEVCTRDGDEQSDNPYEPPTTPYNCGVIGCLLSDKVTFSEYDVLDPFDGYPEYTYQTWHQETKYIREHGRGGINPNTPPPYADGWTFLSENSTSSIWWRCPSARIYNIKNGYSLMSILWDYFQLCGLEFHSQFLNGIGGTMPDNIAYEWASVNCKHLTLHHISDVNGYSNSDVSHGEAWDIDFNDLINDLIKMFNLDYYIDGNMIILEHVSFFDIYTPIQYGVQQDEYTYDTNSIKEENYEFPVKGSVEFQAQPIIYDCGESKETIALSLISTDLKYIQENDDVPDSGFCLVSNELVQGKLHVIDGNKALSWAELQENLFTFGRKYKSGSINGNSMNFDSWRGYRNYKLINTKTTIPFNPLFDVTTNLGRGEVEKAKLNINTCDLAIKVKYV